MDFSKILTFLQGKKTYIVAVAIAVLGCAEAMGWFSVPEWVWPIAGGLGLTTLRAGVTGVAQSIKDNTPKAE
jgi:hypothetical protein